MSSATLTVSTPLGDIEIRAVARGAPVTEGWLQTAPIRPALPPGMSVDACHAVVLGIRADQAPLDVELSARCRTTRAATSDVEAGEGLEARTWWADTHVLTIGTEDEDALRLRCDGRVPLPRDPVQHHDDGIAICLVGLPAGEVLALHFIVAWNALPEAHESACWYAVDQRHAEVAAVVARSPRLQQASFSDE